MGNRGYIAAQQHSPPPGSYKLPSDFDSTLKKGRVFSFGTARELGSKAAVKDLHSTDSTVPGPGAYNVAKAVGTDGLKFSFRIRDSHSSTWAEPG